MKRTLILTILFLLAAPAVVFAQGTNTCQANNCPPVVTVASDPTGNLCVNAPQVTIYNGKQYGCSNGTMALSGGGGGSSVGTAGQAQGVGATPGSFAALSCTDNGITWTCTEPVSAPSFTGTGSDPFYNYPSNPAHVCTTGDLYNNAGVLTWCDPTAVPVVTLPTIVVKTGSKTGTNYTTTSTTSVAIDGTNLSYAVLIPTGYKLTINSNMLIDATTSADVLLYDGASPIPATHGYLGFTGYLMFPLQAVIVGDGATHTITLQWFSQAGTTLYAVNSTAVTPMMIFRLEKAN